MKLSVVICTYNRANLLEKCLNSFTSQTEPYNNFEIIVVDNKSNDLTQEIIKRFASLFPNLRFFIEENQGISYARNKGWLEAKGEYVAYLDDDAMADKTWVEKIIKSFEKIEPKPEVIGGKILPYFIEPKPLFFDEKKEIRTWGDESKFLTARNAPFGFSGSNMTIQKKVLSEFGGFSTKYGKVRDKIRPGHEPEFFSRIFFKYNHFWYDPSIIVYHYVDPIKYNLIYRFKRSVILSTISSVKIRIDQVKNFLKRMFK